MKNWGVVSYPILVGFFFSCGIVPSRQGQPLQKGVVPAYKKQYDFIDKAGAFSVYREVGRSVKDKNYVVKKSVYSQGEKKKVVEQSIAIATPGRLRNVNIVRPQIAQYTVWFDKKKYFSELKLDTKSKSMVLRMKSPEERWKGSRKVPFPRGTGVFCFFSMIVECVGATGFIEKAIEKGVGTMNFHIIWDGYPYVQEQYQHLPDEIFSSAEFVFEGDSQNGGKKFSLTTGNQTIFYVVKPGGFLTKIFWVSQGMSMVERVQL